jgi:hypothetical protein
MLMAAKTDDATTGEKHEIADAVCLGKLMRAMCNGYTLKSSYSRKKPCNPNRKNPFFARYVFEIGNKQPSLSYLL